MSKLARRLRGGRLLIHESSGGAAQIAWRQIGLGQREAIQNDSPREIDDENGGETLIAPG